MGSEELYLRKLALTISMTALVVLGGLFLGQTAHAQPSLDDIKKERKEIKEKLSDAEAEIADVLYDIEQQNKTLTDLEDALKDNEAHLNEAKETIEKYEDDIVALEEEVASLNDAIEQRNEILKNRIAAYQANGGKISYLDVLLGSKNFKELISHTNTINRITESDTELIEQQERDKAIVEINKTQIERNIKEQEELLVELEGIEQLTADQKEEIEKKIEKLNEKEAEFKEKKADLETEDTKLSKLEKNVRNSIATYNARPATSSSSSSSVSYTMPTGSGSKSDAVNAGFKYIGVPYRHAGKTPNGFDCSGFVSWAYGQAGYSIPSSTSGLQYVGTKISYSDAQPGDLVFFNTYKTNGHVGIYLGGGKFIGSQNSTGLAVADMTSGYWKRNFAGHVRRLN